MFPGIPCEVLCPVEGTTRVFFLNSHRAVTGNWHCRYTSCQEKVLVIEWVPAQTTVINPEKYPRENLAEQWQHREAGCEIYVAG